MSWPKSGRSDVLDPTEAELSPKSFAVIAGFMRRVCGVTLPENKRFMVQTRLHKRLGAAACTSFEAYIEHAFGGSGNAEEQAELIHVLTTHKTDFFREPYHFELLRRWVVDTYAPGARRPVRIWSAACSTGEEPYSIAMSLMNVPGVDFKVLATDVSASVLQAAKAGVYDQHQVAPIPPELRQRYLRPVDGRRDQVQIAREIQGKVRFASLNLNLSSYPIRPQADVVFCRNVLIYFDRFTQINVLRRILAVLAPGGILLLGHSESIQGMALPLRGVGVTAYEHCPTR